MNHPKSFHALATLCVAAFLAFSLLGMKAAFAQVPQYTEQNTDRPGQDFQNIDLPPKGPESLWGSAADCQPTYRQMPCLDLCQAGHSGDSGEMLVKACRSGGTRK